MSVQFTDEQLAFVEALRDFCARECGTQEQRRALTDDHSDDHNPALYRKLAELGYVGVSVAEEYGGAGGGAVDMCLLLEETSRGLAPVHGLGVTMIVAGAYDRFGTKEQKQDVLGTVAAGSVKAIAMSEPGAGSDVGSLACRAQRSNGGWVVNGQKTWITAAQDADDILLVARTGRTEAKHDGLTMFRVPTDTAGVEIHGIPTMAGAREVNDVFFTDCSLPADSVLGEEGAAWKQLMAGLNKERLIIAAMMLGLGRRAFDDTIAYVTERRQFNRPVGSFQAIRHRLADLATELECCRLLVYDVAALADAYPDRSFPREASMAKLKVTETAKRIALEGVQMMGGYGYATEYDMERHLRKAIATTIYGGTSEIQRDIIGKTYGL